MRRQRKVDHARPPGTHFTSGAGRPLFKVAERANNGEPDPLDQIPNEHGGFNYFNDKWHIKCVDGVWGFHGLFGQNHTTPVSFYNLDGDVYRRVDV